MTFLKDYQNSITATIASGAAITDGIDLAHTRACKLVMPAAWTAASITFQISCDGTTYADLYDENGNEITLSPAAGKAYKLPLDTFADVRWLKIRSGTGAIPANQAAARTITLNVRSFA